jgi:hypothetical protein
VVLTQKLVRAQILSAQGTGARKGRPEKKQTGWCSDNEAGGGDGKAER